MINVYRITVFLTLVCSIVSCRNEKKRYTTISEVKQITHDGADISAYYNLFKRDDLTVGLKYMVINKPYGNYTWQWVSDKISKSDTLEFNLRGLVANTTYEVRSFVDVKSKSEDLSSDGFQFTTALMPYAPCNLSASELIYNDSTTSMSPLVLDSTFEQNQYRYTYTAESDQVRLMFTFSAKPLSIVYPTHYNGAYLSTNVAKIDFYIKRQNYDCHYEFDAGQDIHVRIDGNRYSFSFCDLIGSHSAFGGDCPDDILLSGEINNF